jgi:magnesium transporter
MPIKYLIWDETGKIVNEGDDRSTVSAFLQQENLHLWLDLENYDKEEIEWMGSVFNFHYLALEDCINLNQRSKVEEYDGYMFFVLHHSYLDSDERLQTEELHIFLGPRFIVSVHQKPLHVVDFSIARCKGEPHTLEKGCDFIFYMLSDHLVDDYFPLLDNIEDKIDDLEDKVISSPNREFLSKIFTLKQDLVKLRKIIGPLREVFSLIYRRDYGLIKEKTYLYIRDVHDHLVRIHDIIDSYRDMLGNMLDVYLSTVSNNLNQVMKRLTIIATIFMPLGFIVGFFGMNFEKIPFDSNILLTVALLICIILPLGMVAWFYKEKWF